MTHIRSSLKIGVQEAADAGQGQNAANQQQIGHQQRSNAGSECPAVFVGIAAEYHHCQSSGKTQQNRPLDGEKLGNHTDEGGLHQRFCQLTADGREPGALTQLPQQCKGRLQAGSTEEDPGQIDEGKLDIQSIQSSLDILNDIIHQEKKQWIYKQIYQMNERDRNVMLLSIQKDLSDKEIATILNLKTEHVRVIKNRAKNKLIELYQKEEKL